MLRVQSSSAALASGLVCHVHALSVALAALASVLLYHMHSLSEVLASGLACHEQALSAAMTSGLVRRAEVPDARCNLTMFQAS